VETNPIKRLALIYPGIHPGGQKEPLDNARTARLIEPPGYSSGGIYQNVFKDGEITFGLSGLGDLEWGGN